MITLPEMDAVVGGASDGGPSALFGCESGMVEKSPHVERSVIGADIQPHQTVRGVAQFAAEEVLIPREERDGAKLVEQRNDVRIFDARARHVANLLERNVPLAQERQLI